MDVGEGNGLSDLTQSMSLLLGSVGEGRPCMAVLPTLFATCLLSPTELPGEGCLVLLDLPLSTPSGTGWMTPLWLGAS